METSSPFQTADGQMTDLTRDLMSAARCQCPGDTNGSIKLSTEQVYRCPLCMRVQGDVPEAPKKLAAIAFLDIEAAGLVKMPVRMQRDLESAIKKIAPFVDNGGAGDYMLMVAGELNERHNEDDWRELLDEMGMPSGPNVRIRLKKAVDRIPVRPTDDTSQHYMDAQNRLDLLVNEATRIIKPRPDESLYDAMKRVKSEGGRS